MTERPFDYDPLSGLETTFESTPEGFVLRYRHDAQPVLDLNAAKRSMGRDFYASDKDLWKAAEIPIGVQYKWLIEHGVDVLNKDHWPKVRRLLNDPEWRYLKTADIII